MAEESLKCVDCGKPVVYNRGNYALFEQRHWLCFHLAFEHDGDPDTACADPSCPWFHLEAYRADLKQRGVDPATVISAAFDARYGIA